MSKGTGVNAAEKAMAHRFSEKSRGTIEKNKNNLRVPGASQVQAARFQEVDSISEPFQGTPNVWNQELWRELKPGSDKSGVNMVSRFDSKDLATVPGPEVDGYAGMGKMPDRDDQHYDNVVWYKDVYSKIGDNKPHGDDLGKVYLDDKFFGYLERKKEAQFARSYELFKLNMVDLSSPPVRDYWQKKFPQLVNMKMQFYKNRETIRARMNEIKIRGPNSQEDLEFIYLYNLGMFESAEIQDVSEYLMNPQNRKLWLAAINEGVIDWNKVEWNDDQQEPPSTPIDGISARLPFPPNLGITKWQNIPTH